MCRQAEEEIVSGGPLKKNDPAPVWSPERCDSSGHMAYGVTHQQSDNVSL